MKIKDKLWMDRAQLEQEGPITIVAFGDSVTHGALEIDVTNYETVYWNVLRKKLLEVRDYVPINVINAGIGGTTATASLQRMDKQVLAHNPDLVIVCFGLNDVNRPLEDYLSAMEGIFQKAKASGVETIFLTPNMLNTYVSEKTAEEHMEYAAVTAEYQNSGRMDLYISSAIKLADSMDISVCDCYGKWKQLSETQDTTQLLANFINHPSPKMHQLFADMLFEMIMEGETAKSEGKESSMYQGK